MKPANLVGNRFFATLSVLAGFACGGDDDGGANTADAGAVFDAGASGGDNFGDKQWSSENASASPGTLSHDGVITDFQGELWGAFAEPDSAVLFDQDIVSMRGNAGSWTSEARTIGDNVQFAFPDIDTRASSAFLVYSGPLEGGLSDNDIVYSRYADSEWDNPVDLTTPNEVEARGDIRPKLMVYSGDVSVAYFSYSLDGDGSPDGASELRVLNLDGDLAPETVYSPEAPDDCFDLDAVVDPGGNHHVVLDCGQGSNTILLHATDASGAWETSPIALGGALAAKNPKLALYGNAVSLVFSGAATCSGSPCTKAFYARLSASGEFETPTKVVVGNEEEQHPTIAVHDNTVVIAFHRFNNDGFADIFIAYSTDDGAQFSIPENLTPGTAESDEWKPASLLFTADGNAHFVYDQIFADQAPLNSDVIHAFTR